MSSERRRQARKSIVGLCFLLAVTACGKKGPPLPPLRYVPAPTKDLKVSQQGNRLLLDFAYPKTTPGGQALTGVTEVDVWEVIRPVPSAVVIAPTTPTTTKPTTATTTPPATTPPATTPAKPATGVAPAPQAPKGPQPLSPRELEAAAKVRLKLKGAEVGAASVGDRIVIALPLPVPFPEKPELRYYAVRTAGPNADLSELSNQAILTPKLPPPPPAETTVKPRGDGVEVAWTDPLGAPKEIVGFNVYRRDSQVRAFSPPLHASALGDRAFIDTTARFGQSYIYAVTTVLSREPLIESAVKSEIEIKYVDRFPPPVPTEAVALVEAGRIRLVWRASEAPDLAGYRVYRLDLRQVKGEYRRLTDTLLTEVQYTDSQVASGTTYVYRVTAVDQVGNESDPAEVRATAQ